MPTTPALLQIGNLAKKRPPKGGLFFDRKSLSKEESELRAVCVGALVVVSSVVTTTTAGSEEGNGQDAQNGQKCLHDVCFLIVWFTFVCDNPLRVKRIVVLEN